METVQKQEEKRENNWILFVCVVISVRTVRCNSWLLIPFCSRAALSISARTASRVEQSSCTAVRAGAHRCVLAWLQPHAQAAWRVPATRTSRFTLQPLFSTTAQPEVGRQPTIVAMHAGCQSRQPANPRLKHARRCSGMRSRSRTRTRTNNGWPAGRPAPALTCRITVQMQCSDGRTETVTVEHRPRRRRAPNERTNERTNEPLNGWQTARVGVAV